MAALIGSGLAAAGCGSGSGSVVTLPTHVSTLRTTPPTGLRPRPRSPNLGGPSLGASQRVSSEGASLTVTMVRLYDPLVGSGASLLAGTRAVGVVAEIVNAGPATYDSSATGDISLVTSSGSVNPVFASTGVCKTPLQDFDNYITSGGSRSGCVAFAVAAGARVEAIRFSPHAGAAGRLTWRASSG